MPPKSVPPHYECLGVDPSISDADLSRHYKKLSLQLHPDRAAYRNDAANEEHVQARFQRITEAYAVLSDPEKRSAYDTKHGVNFQSRLEHLQTKIWQHNSSAVLRCSSSVSTASGSVVTAASAVIESTENGVERKGHVGASLPHSKHIESITQSATGGSQGANGKDDAHGDEQDDDEHADEDEDDDYVPEAIACSGRDNSSKRDRTDFAAAQASRDSSSSSSEAEHAAASKVRRLFSLHPRTTLSDDDITDSGMPITQYRGVTLTRILSDARSADLTDCADADAKWGIALDGNVLMGLQNSALDAEGGAEVKGRTELVFPSTVQQVNDVMVHADSDIVQLLRKETERAKTVRESDVQSLSSIAAEQGCTTSVEQLQLVLAFSTEAYDLVGDIRLLCDEAVLRDVVPEWCVAAEVPALLPDVRVLSVNGMTVHSAEELRQALRDGAGGLACAAKRPRTTPSIVLQCCRLCFS